MFTRRMPGEDDGIFDFLQTIIFNGREYSVKTKHWQVKNR
jgi:hypothetical protein